MCSFIYFAEIEEESKWGHEGDLGSPLWNEMSGRMIKKLGNMKVKRLYILYI